MYIGKVADATGASPKAIRHYESLGLIPKPQREGKYRVYTPEHIKLVKIIRRGQAAGFTLAELKPLFQLQRESGSIPHKAIKEAVQTRLQSIAAKKAVLDDNETLLNAFSDSLNEDPEAYFHQVIHPPTDT